MAVYIAMATGCMVMFSTIVPRAWCSERLTADSAHGEQILALHHEIGSIDVEYLATTDNHESEDPMSYMEVRYIAKERKRLRHAAHWSTMRSRASDINNIVQVLTNNEFNALHVSSRVFERNSYDEMSTSPWKLRHDLILDCLGWWPNNDVSPPMQEGSPIQFLPFICSAGTYIIDGTASVRGISCIKAHLPGADALWLSPGHSYAILRRESFDLSSGTLRRRQTAGDLALAQHANMRVWYPGSVLIEHFDSIGHGQPVSSIRVSINKFEINSVEDSAFDITLLPGTLVVDRDSGKVSHVPGGANFIDQTVDIAGSILRDHQKAKIKDSQHTSRKSSSLKNLGAMAVVMAIALIAYSWRRLLAHRL